MIYFLIELVNNKENLDVFISNFINENGGVISYD